MSSNSNATNSNSSNKTTNKKNTKNEKVYRRFDTILKKTPEIYDNYLVLVNDFIKSKLANVNNSKFYNSSKEGFNSNNETLSVSNQKKVYLNTYVIPLLYLINSYEYQKYYKNTMAIEANQLIMANIDYYKNYFFNYKLPIIKSVNVDIYKYNYGNASSNNNMNIDFSKSKKKKRVKIESKGIVAKVDKDIKENINKLLELLVKSNIIFNYLLIPYKIINKYNKLIQESDKFKMTKNLKTLKQHLSSKNKKKSTSTTNLQKNINQSKKYESISTSTTNLQKNINQSKKYESISTNTTNLEKKIRNQERKEATKYVMNFGKLKNKPSYIYKEKKGGGNFINNSTKDKMNDFYHENLFYINKIIITCIKYIFDKPEEFNVDLLKLMKNRSDTLDYKFDIFETEIEDYKDIFDITKIYEQIIENYNKIKKENQKIIDELTSKKTNYQTKKKNSPNYELELETLKSSIKKDINEITNLKNEYVFKTENNKLNLKGKKYKSEIQKKISQFDRSIKKKEDDQQKLRSKLNKIQENKIEINKNKSLINNKTSAIEDINNIIKKLESEKITNIQSLNFNFSELKKKFTEFFKNNIEIMKQIQKITDFEQQKKKQDKYKFYFDKDTLLINIIKKLNKKFDIKINELFILNPITNIPQINTQTKTINYQTLKSLGQNYEKLINIMKLYKKKENNNNTEYKSKIINLLNDFDTYNTSQLESLISEEGILSNSYNSNNIFELISTYINNVQSKKETYDNSFFKKVMLDSTYYKTEDTLLYFKEIQEIHAKLLININKYLYEIESKGEKNIVNAVFKENFKKELEYLNNCFEKMKQKYNRLKTNIYNTKDTIYVYTYTDSIKFYFITLSLIELYLHNSAL